MKTKLFFLIIYCLLFTECKAQWVQIGPSSGMNVTGLAANSSNIIGGINSHIYLSSNNGQNWMQTSFNTASIWALTTNGNSIFVGTNGNGLYVSSNNGQNWSIPLIDNVNWIASIAFNSSAIFAGTGIGTNADGVHRSTNNGLNWTHCLTSTAVFALAAIDSNVYAIARWGEFYRSTNNGVNWSQISTLPNTYESYSLIIHNSNLFAGTEIFPQHGIMISTNDGLNWTQTSLNNVNAYSLASIGSNIFAGSDSGVYVSTNDGLNWTQYNEGMGSQRVRTVLINGNYVFAGTTGNSVWRRPLSDLVGVEHTGNLLPKNFYLSQNYPNPFNPSTNIKFQIAKSSNVKLIIYDALGKEVETLVNKKLEAGEYEAEFNASDLPSGIYFYKLVTNPSDRLERADGYTETKKMVLIK